MTCANNTNFLSRWRITRTEEKKTQKSRFILNHLVISTRIMPPPRKPSPRRRDRRLCFNYKMHFKPQGLSFYACTCRICKPQFSDNVIQHKLQFPICYRLTVEQNKNHIYFEQTVFHFREIRVQMESESVRLNFVRPD